MRLLIVGNQQNVGDAVTMRLRREGHNVAQHPGARDLLETVLTQSIHLVLLQPEAVPGADLLDLCRVLRQETSALLVLAGPPTSVTQRVFALRAGADDYLTLPIDPDELVARLQAHLRHHPLSVPGAGPAVFRVTEELTLDLAGQRLLGPKRELALSEHEFRLLTCLVRHEGAVLTREALLNAAWGFGYEGETREVDSYIRLLRRKLEPDPRRPRYLLTVWGRGYQYRGPAKRG